jgi:AraC-like DNA-binding protein
LIWAVRGREISAESAFHQRRQREAIVDGVVLDLPDQIGRQVHVELHLRHGFGHGYIASMLAQGPANGPPWADTDPVGTSAVRTPREAANLLLLRARDAMDRRPARDWDVAALAAIALMSPAHFIREFRRAFGESPHRYLQRRRIERAMTLLRTTNRQVTDIAFAVGFSSLGSFSRTFADIVGQSPSRFRLRSGPLAVPGCVAMTWTRPSSAVAQPDCYDATRAAGPSRTHATRTGSSSFGEAAAEAIP